MYITSLLPNALTEEKLPDLSKECEEARRKTRQQIINLPSAYQDALEKLYYEAVTLSEHESVRKTIKDLPVLETALQVLQDNAPGLSQQIRIAIARSIAFKIKQRVSP